MSVGTAHGAPVGPHFKTKLCMFDMLLTTIRASSLSYCIMTVLLSRTTRTESVQDTDTPVVQLYKKYPFP